LKSEKYFHGSFGSQVLVSEANLILVGVVVSTSPVGPKGHADHHYHYYYYHHHHHCNHLCWLARGHTVSTMSSYLTQRYSRRRRLQSFVAVGKQLKCPTTHTTTLPNDITSDGQVSKPRPLVRQSLSKRMRALVDNPHDAMDKRRRRFVGHVLRLPSARPVSAAALWTPEGGTRRRGRPKKTWQDTLRDDLQAMDVSSEEAKSVAGDRKEWRSLVAQCSSGNRTQVWV